MSENIQAHVRIATALSLTIATSGVILRFIARRLNGQLHFLDDWLILAALVSEWGLAIAGLILLENGLGLHISDVHPTNLVTYLKVLYTGAPLYALTIVLIKLSLLVLYDRVFPIRFMTYSCLIVGTVVVCWGFTASLMGLLLCEPVDKAWRPETPGQCLNLVRFYYGLQIPNIVTDVVILVLPLKPILSLRCSFGKKALLGGIFGLGLVVVLFDIIRLIALLDMEGKGTDITWYQVPTAIWTCVEPAVAIMTACLPHLKPIVSWVQHYLLIGGESQSDFATAEENHESTFGTATAPATPIADRSVSDAIEEKTPSHYRIDFMSHITSNVADLNTSPSAPNRTRRSSSSTPFSPRPDSFGYDVPVFPDMNGLLVVHHPNDRSTGSPVSDRLTALPSSPCPSRASIETVIGIESALAAIEKIKE